MKKLLLSLLLTLPILGSAFAQEESPQKQESYVFHFMKGKDAFFVPYKGNGILLDEFCALVEKYKTLLHESKIYIYVESYATNGNNNQTASQVAHIQRNRVKSEFITREGATEDMFVTQKYNAEAYGSEALRNVVVVTIPASIAKIIAIVGEQKAEIVKQYHQAVKLEKKAKADAIIAEQRAVVQKAEQVEQQRQVKITAIKRAKEQEVAKKVAKQKAIKQAHQAELSRLQAIEDAKSKKTLSLRANLLHWATTTMNVGIEVRPTSSIGIVLDFDYAPLTWNDGLNGYRAFNFQPQVRYYFGKENNFYAGGEFHLGTLNWKLETKGHQGSFIGGGVVFGYKLPLNDRFDLDFNLGGGYTNYKYDKYMDVSGKHLDYSPNHKKDYWGLTSAGATLVWKIFR